MVELSTARKTPSTTIPADALVFDQACDPHRAGQRSPCADLQGLSFV
jgi:hypothetical protein